MHHALRTGSDELRGQVGESGETGQESGQRPGPTERFDFFEDHVQEVRDDGGAGQGLLPDRYTVSGGGASALVNMIIINVLTTL